MLEANNGDNVNATWHFDVRKNATILIRAHFCDIIGLSANVVNNFSFHIDRKFASEVNNIELKAPFYRDFVVDSGYLMIGTGTQEDSTDRKAYLNGVEIMEFVTEWNLEPPRLAKLKDRIPVIVGMAFSLFSVLFAAVFLVFRWKKVKDVCNMDLSSRSRGRFLNFGMSRKASSVSSLASRGLKLRMELSEILYPTREFDDDLLIGKGGFGKVYVGL